MSFPRLADIVGQESALRTLAAATPPKGDPAGAFLFVGPEGVGKRSTALAWARTLFCATGGADACGRCGPCKKIEHGNFPDLITLAPEAREKKVKEEIDIQHIRELIARVSYRPYEASRKVAVIDGVDRMNTPAANAFLKTLEEPPGDTTLILVAVNLNALPATIISRCKVARFGALDRARLEDLLVRAHGMDPARARTAASISRGAPGMALAETLDEQSRLREEALTLLRDAPSMSAGAVFNLARGLDKAADKARVDRLLIALQELIREALVVKLTGKYVNLIHTDIAPAIRDAAAGYTAGELVEIYRLAGEMAAARRWNVNPLLVTSLLLLERRSGT